MNRIISFLIRLVISAALVYYLYAIVEVRVYRAVGTSMDSTIYNGELLLSIKPNKIKRNHDKDWY